MVEAYVSAAILFVFAIFGGSPPYIIKKYTKTSTHTHLSPLWLRCALAITAGTLLGGSILHLLMDAHEVLSNLYSGIDYPLAGLISLSCFVGLLFIDHCIKHILKNSSKNKSTHKSEYVHTQRHLHTHQDTPSQFYKRDTTHPFIYDEEAINMAKNYDWTPIDNTEVELDTHISTHEETYTQLHKKWVPFVLFIVLAIHCLIEGLALGATDDMIILTSIIAHKAVVAFGLGSILIDANFGAIKYFSFILMFSLISPLGVLISHLLTTNSTDTHIISLFGGILTALGSGTFLYISIIEILLPQMCENQQFDRPMYEVWMLFVCFLFGLTIMALTANV